MNKNLKSLMIVVLSLLMIIGSSVTVFAEERSNQPVETSGEIRPMSDTTHYYIIKNKVTKPITRAINSYLTTMWAKASEYNVEKSRTTSISLTTSTTNGSFLSSLVGSTGEFDVSYSRTFAVGSVIPADPSRYSKLTIEAEYNNYTGDLYYIIDYGLTKTEHYEGSGKVKEPRDLYLEVLYQ